MGWVVDYAQEADGSLTVLVQTELGIIYELRNFSPLLTLVNMGDRRPGLAYVAARSGRVLPVAPAANPHPNLN